MKKGRKKERQRMKPCNVEPKCLIEISEKDREGDEEWKQARDSKKR